MRLNTDNCIVFSVQPDTKKATRKIRVIIGFRPLFDVVEFRFNIQMEAIGCMMIARLQNLSREDRSRSIARSLEEILPIFKEAIRVTSCTND